MPHLSVDRLLRLLAVLMLALLAAAPLLARAVTLDREERAWVEAQGDRPLTVGFDPYAGMDSFEFQGRRIGLLPALLEDMRGQLGLHLVPAEVKSWDDAYTRFVQGRIDVLYGANVTPERQKIMRFTAAAQRYPYTLFSQRDSNVQTLGDLDGKRVGFLSQDFVIQQLPREFPNVHFTVAEFETQAEGLQALADRRIDGFVTSGGGVEYDFLNQYPSLVLVAEIKNITSDMTFAVARDQLILARLIDRYLQERTGRIAAMARRARQLYNRKVLQLTPAELQWLEARGEAVVGVAEDYLPFDHFDGGDYKGIMGATLQRIADIVGLRFKVVGGPFAELIQQAQDGSIDVLNMAKTEQRQQHFLFPHAVSTERDIIIGLKSSPAKQDIYELGDSRVAVIDGFWHEEHLRKNLKNPRIVRTANIIESLRKVRAGEADYLIENPTVAEFYINGLGYTDLVKRGLTSKDSFIYFGVTRRQPELAGIMDKVIPLIDFEATKYAGIQSVPTLGNEANRQLMRLLAALAAVLLLVSALTIRIVRKLIAQRAKTQFLREREHLLYTDSLTGFHNRNYFSQLDEKAGSIPPESFPQAIVVADMNNLKLVNDAHGHAAGDRLIQMFAEAARAQWPQAEAFRLGGDEFLFLLPRCDETRLLADIEALRLRCGETRHQLASGVWISPSAALGHALRMHAGQSLMAGIAAADERMYAAKALAKRRRSDWPGPVASPQGDSSGARA